MTVTRGTTNGNARGSSTSRAARRGWLLATYAADLHIVRLVHRDGTLEYRFPSDAMLERIWLLDFGPDSEVSATALPTCRCYRCGKLLADMPDPRDPNHVTVDRIIPGKQGGTYRRNNIRPACGACNSETGGAIRGNPSLRA